MNTHKEPKQCNVCGKWFDQKENEPRFICAVLHAPDRCCHYGENEAIQLPQEEQPKEWEKEFDKWFGHGKKGHLHGLLAEDYYKEVKAYISSLLANQRSEIAEQLKDLLQVKASASRMDEAYLINRADALKIVEGQAE